jgi:hypothetical protein
MAVERGKARGGFAEVDRWICSARFCAMTAKDYENG